MKNKMETEEVKAYPQRKMPRMQAYDYATPNYYFITICTYGKEHLFQNEQGATEVGKIAERELLNIEEHFSDVRIDKYVVMPNHIHAIIVIGCKREAEESSLSERSRPFPTLSEIVGLYKSGVSRIVHQKMPGLTVWQRSFYDHIVRNEADYQRIWQYIDDNPRRWEEDELF